MDDDGCDDEGDDEGVHRCQPTMVHDRRSAVHVLRLPSAPLAWQGPIVIRHHGWLESNVALALIIRRRNAGGQRQDWACVIRALIITYTSSPGQAIAGRSPLSMTQTMAESRQYTHEYPHQSQLPTPIPRPSSPRFRHPTNQTYHACKPDSALERRVSKCLRRVIGKGLAQHGRLSQVEDRLQRQWRT